MPPALSRPTPPLPPGLPPVWWQAALCFGLVFAAALRAAWSTLDGYFLSDDFAYIGHFYHFPLREWPALFLRDWSGGLWGYNLPELRPFAALTFILDAHCWGANPLGYHFTNLALDTGCACLVALIVWRLHAVAWWLGCAAGILFACHPAHAEPVAWITGRVDLLGTFAYLAGFFAAGRFLQAPERRGWAFAAVVMYAVGCFSKEFCLTLPVIVLAWWLVYGRAAARPRQIGALFLGFMGVFALYLSCRRLAFGPGSADGAAFDFLGHDYAERQVDYLRWLLTPLYDVGRDYRPELVSVAGELLMALLISVLGGLVIWRWLRTAPSAWGAALFFGVIWYLVATLPLVVVTYFSPRHLYFATAGFSIAVTLLIAGLAPRRWLAGACLLAACGYSATRFDHAVAPWRHAAKLSQRVALEAMQVSRGSDPAVVVLLDVPDIYEGVWMWSWAMPFALQPPFMEKIANPVFERPVVYYTPALWSRQRDFQRLVSAPGAVLLTVDQRGQVVREEISARRLKLAAPYLLQVGEKSGADGPGPAWQHFIQTLHAPLHD